jgi:uncharacterized protein
MGEFPAPPTDGPAEEYWAGLAAGELRFQKCSACGHAWLPARQECPCCLLPEWWYQPSAGLGRLVSWVVFHRAYHPYFEGRLPYNVAIVELDEGPRMITNVLHEDGHQLTLDARVQLEIQEEQGWSLARFRCLPDVDRAGGR